MSDSVSQGIGYGVGLGWWSEIPDTWQTKFPGVESYMNVKDYFEFFPGDPAVVITSSGSAYAKDCKVVLLIKDTYEITWFDPVALDPTQMIEREREHEVVWDKRLLEICEDLGIERTLSDCKWFAVASFG